MVITITITNPEDVDSLKAAGVTDLAEHFLPLACIVPDKVTMYECLPAEAEKMCRGEEYTAYEDAWEKGKE